VGPDLDSCLSEVPATANMEADMDIVSSGVILRKDPEGYSVVTWHRHERPKQFPAEGTVYDRLTFREALDVIEMHLKVYTPGDECGHCQGWSQQCLFVDANTAGRGT